MGVMYTFFISLAGIVILLLLKSSEIQKGSKPFSVIRYRMDIIVRKVIDKTRYGVSFVNRRTLSLILAFLVAKISQIVSIVIGKVVESRLFRLIKGKLLPPEGNGTVSTFLKDVAEFKKDSGTPKEEESK